MSVLTTAKDTLESLRRALDAFTPAPVHQPIGRVLSVGDGIARVSGLADVALSELLTFPDASRGLAFNLDKDEIGCILLANQPDIHAGDIVHATGRIARVPVGEELLGRVVDPLGHPLDGGRPFHCERFDPIEKEAPDIISRRPVTRPLATGIKSIDTMIPIGRGQRQLIIGDRSTGKTSIAIDAILNQTDGKVICVYVAIGQRAASTARFIDTLREKGGMPHTIVVVAEADSSAGMKYLAPYAGATISEYFLHKGADTLVIYDDLTKHAQVYRELSLLLRRPPGREAFPGDIFYLHSRLLERATSLSEDLGGGSQTALPIVETQAGNISQYIPTNLISITDGQVCLSSDLFQQGMLPAVDVGRSVSRVGGKTQVPAMRKLAQKIRLSYAQFVELEQFTKFGTSIEESTQRALETGRRIRELLKQHRHAPLPIELQVALLVIADSDTLLDVPVRDIRAFEQRFLRDVRDRAGDLLEHIRQGGELTDAGRTTLTDIAFKSVARPAETSSGARDDAQSS